MGRFDLSVEEQELKALDSYNTKSIPRPLTKG